MLQMQQSMKKVEASLAGTGLFERLPLYWVVCLIGYLLFFDFLGVHYGIDFYKICRIVLGLLKEKHVCFLALQEATMLSYRER